MRTSKVDLLRSVVSIHSGFRQLKNTLRNKSRNGLITNGYLKATRENEMELIEIFVEQNIDHVDNESIDFLHVLKHLATPKYWGLYSSLMDFLESMVDEMD